MSTNSNLVLTCAEYDTTTETCTTQVWAPPQSALPAMPTIDQAESIGAAIFAGLLTIRCMQLFLQPPKELDE